MDEKEKIQEAYEKTVLNEGMFTTVIDDIIRKLTTRVSGKEQSKRLGVMYLQEFIDLIKMMQESIIFFSIICGCLYGDNCHFSFGIRLPFLVLP